MSNLKLLLTACIAGVWAFGADAALKICNDTSDIQSVSIGYKGDVDWTSEGWWNVDPGECVTTVAGNLTQRYYYYRAEVDGGDFEGQNYFFCTDPKEYTIVGDADCEARGYQREDFREFDTGEAATDFTLTLVADVADAAPATPAPVTPAPVAPPGAAADLGLKICNDTRFVQSVSVGYEADSGWTSEGWWNIEPDDCATVLGGELKKRYYYYRAEIDGGPFDFGAFNFCTDPKEYTIVGVDDCAARGYEAEAFAEIDTGPTAKGFTLTLVSDAAAPDTTKPESTPPVSSTVIAPVASGGLRMCNETDYVQEVSIGYEGDGGWTSEGWWRIEQGACSQILATALQKQYYYYRAEIDGGTFDGGGFLFCTSPEAYEIVGDTDCEARGYDSEDFAEINVGEGVTDFIFTLVNDPSAPETTPDATPASGGGLRICNDTGLIQAVSIGYQAADETWTSEGWWNLDPNQCSTVIEGELQKRYYYYRAEVDGGPFEGGGYTFCTTPEEYTIAGDTDCESRGYEAEDFAEIDTGPTATSFVFTLIDAGARAPEPELFEEAAPEAAPEPDAVAGPEAAPATPPPGKVDRPAPTAAPEPEPEPVPEVEPVPEPMPEPVPDPMAEPEPAAPKPPRRGGSRG